jgi:hypothetical protein
MNKILHIGLHIIENDLESFYTNVLNCKIERTFNLQPEDSFNIFGINEEVKILRVSCGGIELELFIDGKIESPTFGHVCFQSSEAERIFETASENGYRTFIRKRNSGETYFISDSNHNLFEIKSFN